MSESGDVEILPPVESWRLAITKPKVSISKIIEQRPSGNSVVHEVDPKTGEEKYVGPVHNHPDYRAQKRQKEEVKASLKKAEEEGSVEGIQAGLKVASSVYKKEGRDRLEPVLCEIIDELRRIDNNIPGAKKPIERIREDLLHDLEKGTISQDFESGYHNTDSGRTMLTRWHEGEKNGEKEEVITDKVKLLKHLAQARNFIKRGSTPTISASPAKRESYKRGFKKGFESIEPDFDNQDKPWFVPESEGKR